MTASAACSPAIGALLMAASGAAWGGWWRWWAKDQVRGPVVFSVMPGGGLMLFGIGLYMMAPTYPFALIGGVGMIASVVGYVLFLWEPSWFGPRWWRESTRRPKQDRTIAGHIAMTAAVPDHHDSEQLARTARLPLQPLQTRRAALLDPALGKPSGLHSDGVAHGRLLLYPEEIVFAANRGDDSLRPGPTIRTTHADDLTAVSTGRGPQLTRTHVHGSRVHIQLRGKSGGTLECARAHHVATALRDTYLQGRDRR